MSRAAAIFADDTDRLHRRTDRMFLWLLLAQWLLAIVLALVNTPWAWVGATRTVHLHVEVAIFGGGVLNALPILLVLRRPGRAGTRHVVAVTQMLWSSILILVTNGRIETHFHVFGSLAFLAVYRDWRVLVTATAVVVADHFVRGMWWPDSIYGIANPEWWRFAEHAAWAVFEDVVLCWSGLRSVREMHEAADREARLEGINTVVEQQVAERTAELEHAMVQRTRVEVELRQAQKLEAVGRLAAGVAHEINTPVQFVSDSCVFLQEASEDLHRLVGEYRELVSATAEQRLAPAAALARARAADLRCDVDALTEEMAQAFRRALDGLGRVAGIVGAMKEFAYPSRDEMAAADVNRAIANTLTVARNEYKYVADVRTELGDLPPVLCHLGDLNQALLNIVVNAAHAIEDRVGATGRGTIVVATRATAYEVVITVRDDGAGIPPAILEHIFDPFFTTKPLGKGTGQGLAIARSIVVDKHGGRLAVASELGVGTTFTVALPLRALAAAA
jgi:signal transduction histidine kinase